MSGMYGLIIGCCLLNSAIQLGEGLDTACPVNEEYVPCINQCNTCQNQGNCSQIALCTSGCDCIKGYLRNGLGLCVPSKLCDVTCRPNEVYLECGCSKTCCDRGSPEFCATQCLTGCFCRDDMVRDYRGRCISLDDCGKPEPMTCGGVNEMYSDCVIPCNDCKIKGKCPFLICNKGCDCIGGYYRDQNGVCIPESHCPANVCGPNSKFSTCASPCPPTCSVKQPFCAQVCVTGCICDLGYVMNDKGICIPEDQCPGPCGPNAVLSTCASPCPPSCSNRYPFCTQVCEIGCICNYGYVKDANGVCIPIDECPKMGNCAEDELYYFSKPDCKNTCENFNNPDVLCPIFSSAGCFCKRDLVLRKDGKCVLPEDCNNLCGPNAEYSNCASLCPPTCGQGNRLCAAVCVNGCVCNPGFILDSNGICIPENQCPQNPNVCDLYEEYNECGSACPATCSNVYSACTEQCVPGCFCKTGYVRENGKCIPIEQCPTNVCDINEEYNDCGTTCPATCSNIPSICTAQCVPGCFCKAGYVLDDNGQCIPIDQCPISTCNENEIYQSCGTACQPTCSDTDPICTKECVSGCFCKDGFIRSQTNGACIDKGLCKNACGDNEEFSPCEDICNRCDTVGPCSFFVCNEGCDCIDEYSRDDNGMCIPTIMCPQNECGPDEQYYECMPDCTNRCYPPDVCTADCNSGCFCREDLVLNDDGICVTKDQCPAPPSCNEDEQFYKCKPDCFNTCENYQIPGVVCPDICVSGCFCKEGLIKRMDGKCVQQEHCFNDGCEPDQQYYNCVPDCQNRCNPSKACAANCKSGCFCRSGLVLREDGKCVTKNKCFKKPAGNKRCKKDEQFYKCKPNCRNTCENYGNRNVSCPDICDNGCFCKQGLVMRRDGICVRPEYCFEYETGGAYSGAKQRGETGGQREIRRLLARSQASSQGKK